VARKARRFAPNKTLQPIGHANDGRVVAPFNVTIAVDEPSELGFLLPSMSVIMRQFP
jgi:hypothetical protein